jgi:hypothetical protein
MPHQRFVSSKSRWLFPILFFIAMSSCGLPTSVSVTESPNEVTVVQTTTVEPDRRASPTEPATLEPTIEIKSPETAPPTLEKETEITTTTPCEVRGAWINPGAFYGDYCDDPNDEECWPVERGDPEVIERINVLLDQLESARLNTLFVAGPRIDGNCGWANRFAFEDFIELAKQRGFSLHVWIANKERPEPFCDDTIQADFTDPQEKYRQADWAMSLMESYGDFFDGVHLDYIRYSDWEPVEKEKMGFIEPTSGEEIGVSATVKQIYQSLQENYPGKKLTAAVFTLEPQYADAHRDGKEVEWDEDVPAWFDQWFNENRDSWYDDAGDYMVPEHMKYQQDPIGWLRESFIDGIMPMQYTMDDDVWNNELDQWKVFTQYELDDYDKVFMGLIWAVDFGHDPEHIARKIKYARANGANGFVIFEFSGWDESLNGGEGGFIDDMPLINALTVDSAANEFDAPFKDTAPSCLVP